MFSHHSIFIEIGMLHPSADLLALTNQFQMVKENLPGHHQSILPKKEIRIMLY